MKNAKYVVKSLTEYESEIYENGVPTGKRGKRVYLCVEKISQGLKGLKDQRSWGGISLNRGVSLADAQSKLPDGSDITGSVRFEGDADDDGFYKAVLV